jgi:hypothetical protein
MSKILRWTGYASTFIGALLIIMAIIGGFRYHHQSIHPNSQAGCNMQHCCCGMMAVKGDSSNYKMHAMIAVAPMGKQDSTKCCKKQTMCCMAKTAAAPMKSNSYQMQHHRIGFHMGLAICFLLLAIALFMISNSLKSTKNGGTDQI